MSEQKSVGLAGLICGGFIVAAVNLHVLDDNWIHVIDES